MANFREFLGKNTIFNDITESNYMLQRKLKKMNQFPGVLLIRPPAFPLIRRRVTSSVAFRSISSETRKFVIIKKNNVRNNDGF